MAYALISNTASAGTSDITTTAIDTTGANLLVIGLAVDDGYNTTPTDSKSNTWTQATSYTQTNVRVRIWYSTPTSVGSGHTVTASGFPIGTVFFAAFSGAKTSSPNDQQSGSNGFVSTLQPGSITPTESGELIVSLFGINSAGSPLSIDSGFTELNEIDFNAGISYGGAMAYLIQNTAAAINPTWTRGIGPQGCTCTQISFKAEPSTAHYLTLLGVGT